MYACEVIDTTCECMITFLLSPDKDKALQMQQLSSSDQPMQSAMAVPVNTFIDGPSR